MSMTALNLREKAAGNKVATRTANSRRSQRVVIDFPVTLFGQSADGKIFAENASTTSVNAHGALILLQRDVDPEKPALLGNPRTQMEAQCRVVFRKEVEKNKFEIGLEFSKPAPRFWGINFPPEDWDPSERKKADAPRSRQTSSMKDLNEK